MEERDRGKPVMLITSLPSTGLLYLTRTIEFNTRKAKFNIAAQNCLYATIVNLLACAAHHVADGLLVWLPLLL